ncbi:transcription repressor NadR [Bacillus sp. FJAT-49736]|uniref:transcription repressor NadR n=1 Tax=Bacillus sp. FJAT-49736 TaxID=2833582 RepID=UPI001BC91A5F|nr:transcription repressor NadR [Bacillus sp. FJAT-49736]MBS4173685.1 transcription repressor NadR [Bacillus sp. FJAT-49736]
MSNKKLLGEERRAFLLKVLQEKKLPITGSELAKETNVSRQVIVNDITLLKAKNEPIIATSQGYLYMQPPTEKTSAEKIIACLHRPEDTEQELNLLVDHGVTVRDVKVEHPVYGDLTASIMVSNRKEVEQFMEKIQSTRASYLSALTEGIHLHTIAASDEKTLEDAIISLRNAGFLLNENE